MWDIGKAITTLAIMAFIAGGVVTGLAFWLIPILWGWLKPLIHAATGA